MIWIAVGIAGALGASTRYVVDHVLGARVSGAFPWATFTINVSGSLLAGAITGLVAVHALPAAVSTVVAGGFLGAYTTFSTAMYETVRLLEDGARALALTYALLPVVASALAATGGWWLIAATTP